MPAALRVTLLGDFALARGADPITVGSSARAGSLLAYLILHQRAPQARERLAFLLWPDSTESQARTNLRRELHHLRRALPRPDEHLRVDRKTLRWRQASPARVDVLEFESALARADELEAAADRKTARQHLDDAAARYGGDLLPGCYERWIEPERDRLRRDCARVLERLARLCENDGDLPAAIRHAERLVRHDPLRETSYARLIDLHGAAGDRAAALDAYQRCEEVLERELGLEPGPATIEARERALAADAVLGPPAREAAEGERHAAGGEQAGGAWLKANERARVGSPRPDPTLPLVGRERERAVIREWVEGTADPDAPASRQVLLLLGEPGIGKTRLLDELASDIRRRGGRAIRGRGFEAETVRPYGAWFDALRSVSGEGLAGSEELGSLLPDVRGGGTPPSDRNRLFDAVGRWLARLADDGGPVAVLIDDIQWLDEASAALLHYVTRVLAGSPVRVACAGRPGELDARARVSELVHALERRGRARTVRLGPMSRESILALARLQREGVDGDDGDRIFVDSGGNPLFALELARAPVGSDAEDGRSVEDLIRRRLARLDEPAREALSWAAALGRSFDPSTIALLAERPLPDLLPALRQLEAHGILRPGEGVAYDFSHDIVRRTAYEMVSGPRRRLVHLHIARTLSEGDDPDGTLAGDVAHHAALGGDAALAARASVTAGERSLRVFAFAEATELVRRGIEHARALDGPERVRLHMALLRVAVGARHSPGRAAELDEELRALVAEARSLGLIDEEAVGYGLLSTLNYAHEEFGRVHETSVRAAETLQDGEVDPVSDPAVAARTLAHAGACLASIERDMRRAEALLRKAESLAERAGGVEVSDVSLGFGAVRRFAGDHEEAVGHLERGLRLARRAGDHFLACELLSLLVMLELDAGAPGPALARCRELKPVAEKLRGGSEAPYARALEAAARYDLAEREGPDDLAGDGVPGALADALDGLRRLDASRKLAYVLTAAAGTELSAGRPGRARERAAEAFRLARVVDHRSGIARAGALRVRSLLVLDEVAQAEEMLDALREELGGTDGLSARAREALTAVEARLSPVP